MKEVNKDTYDVYEGWLQGMQEGRKVGRKEDNVV